MKKSFILESDCLDIIKRLKSVDRDYFVVVNLDTRKYELHHKSQKNSYCLTLPYDCLDERAVSLTLKTRVQNADEIFAQMEADNQKNLNKRRKEVLNDFEEKLYDS